MTLTEIIAEMHRKPDPEILIEWIERYVDPPNQPGFAAIADAIDAYHEGVDR